MGLPRGAPSPWLLLLALDPFGPESEAAVEATKFGPQGDQVGCDDLTAGRFLNTVRDGRLGRLDHPQLEGFELGVDQLPVAGVIQLSGIRVFAI